MSCPPPCSSCVRVRVCVCLVCACVRACVSLCVCVCVWSVCCVLVFSLFPSTHTYTHTHAQLRFYTCHLQGSKEGCAKEGTTAARARAGCTGKSPRCTRVIKACGVNKQQVRDPRQGLWQGRPRVVFIPQGGLNGVAWAGAWLRPVLADSLARC